MLKQLSLMTKKVVGFALILTLLIALAVVGYRGLSGVVEHSQVSDSINAVGASLTRARLHEQRFILSRNAEDAASVRHDLDAMKAEIDRADTADVDADVKQQSTNES